MLKICNNFFNTLDHLLQFSFPIFFISSFTLKHKNVLNFYTDYTEKLTIDVNRLLIGQTKNQWFKVSLEIFKNVDYLNAKGKKCFRIFNYSLIVSKVLPNNLILMANKIK